MEIADATFRTQIAAEKNAELAALALINGIVERYEAAGTDIGKINAVTTNLKANRGAYAEAVVANTAREASDLDKPSDTRKETSAERDQREHQEARGSSHRA